MFSKDRSSLTNSRAFLGSATLAAFAAATLAWSAGSAIRATFLEQNAAVRVDVSRLAWWTDLKLGFEPADVSHDAVKVEPLPATPMTHAPGKIVSRVTRHKIRHHVFAKASVMHVSDEIRMAASAPIVIEHVSAVAVPPAAAPKVDLASEAEKNRLRMIQRQLRGRFFASLNPTKTVDTQVALAVSAPAEVKEINKVIGAENPVSRAQTAITEMPRATVRPPLFKAWKLKKKAALQIEARQAKSESVSVAATQAPVASVLLAKSDPNEIKSFSGRVVSSSPPAPSAEAAESVIARPVQKVALESIQPDHSGNGETVRSPKSEDLPEHGAVRQSDQAIRAVNTQGNLEVANGQPVEAPGMNSQTALTIPKQEESPAITIPVSDYPSHTLLAYSGPLVNQQTAIPPTPYKPIDPPKRDAGKSDDDFAHAAKRFEKAMGGGQSAGHSGSALLGASSSGEAVEAFDSSTPISGSVSDPLTLEGQSGGTQSSWIRTRVENYWPTLSWRSASVGGEVVPMVSANTSLLLAKLAGAPLLTEAGIVFGRVPAGSALEFSGRAEGAVYLDEERNPVSPAALEKDRYFAFVNVSPGANLVFLSNPSGGTQVAVAAPVVGGMATYLDLRAGATHVLNGQVLDGANSQATAVAGASVRVVGQPGKSSVTDGSGNFQLADVATVSDMPIFVEVQAKGGFTHRFRMLPSALGSARFYIFGQSQIQTWLGQLEGGISPDSALVVAALPQGLVSAPGAALPSLRPLVANATLAPETYTLSPEDRLLVKTPLDGDSPRFLSVQVPDGAVVAQVKDQAGRRVWSELVYASPGVVNVLGPMY